MTLKELEIGDIFYSVKDKSRRKWLVRGKVMFNLQHGSPTRVCQNLTSQEWVSKSCRIDVVKLRDSIKKRSV